MALAQSLKTPPSEGRFAVLAQRYARHREEFSILAARLGDVADRLGGSTPVELAKAGAHANDPSNTASALEAHAEGFDELINRFSAVVERIERL